MTTKTMTHFVCANCGSPCFEKHWIVEFTRSIVDVGQATPPTSCYKDFEPKKVRFLDRGRICSDRCMEEFKAKYPNMKMVESVGQ